MDITYSRRADETLSDGCVCLVECSDISRARIVCRKPVLENADEIADESATGVLGGENVRSRTFSW